MEHLGENHFLSLSRPDILVGLPQGVPDTTTLAAHDFDVDTRTGFMPPQPPPSRLPHFWDQWEDILDDAISQGIQLGDEVTLSGHDKRKSETWRHQVRNLPVLPIVELKRSEVLLRRGHKVLAWIMHFYIHSLPPTAESIRIPPSISLPLLQISAQLQLPPLLTYSDNVLYNWSLDDPNALPSQSTIQCHTTFTSTSDEAEFYLVSARIELAAVEALDLMRSTMDEAFVGDDIAIRRITEYLHQLADIIHHIKCILLDIKTKCNPDVFYHKIRPWLRGEDSQSGGRKWIFEGIEQDPSLVEPPELSGPSAGQSSLLQALDIFLGVNHYSSMEETSLLKRMRLYMPRHHRAFLSHLENNPRPLRQLVITVSSASENGKAMLKAYNNAVLSLKELRSSHMIIVTLFIIGPARRNDLDVVRDGKVLLKGTGGTDVVRFLKGVRDQTGEALIDSP